MQHGGAEIRMRLLDHHTRHCAATGEHALEFQMTLVGGVEILLHPGEQVQPDCRHRAAEVYVFVANQFEQAGAVELHPGQDDFGAGARRGEWNAPAVDVKQRRAQQQRIARGYRHRIGCHQEKLCSTAERWLCSTPFGLPVVPDV